MELDVKLQAMKEQLKQNGIDLDALPPRPTKTKLVDEALKNVPSSGGGVWGSWTAHLP
jgi:short-subunit dehydrogenase